METDRQPGRRPSSQANGPRKRPSRALRQQQAKAEEPVDDSAWIHRDKLAQIEIQEMEQAGMHVRQPHRSDSVSQMRSNSRAASRTGMRRTPSRDQIAAEDEQYAEMERKRVSTIHAAEEEDYEGVELHPGFDPELRTPEEVAAANEGYRQHAVRPSTSRIPISKGSPAGLVNGTTDRQSPRSRSGSNAFPTTWDDLQYAKRLRSNSVGSGVLLDDSDHLQQDQPTRTEQVATAKSTPTKAKTAAKAPPSRKPLNDASSNRANARPPSSSGAHTARPSTSQNRPEGEAPWIATMYKPDPRLPPDQQMLPTHAKRMMQEQWEKEGKIGNAYDRDLRLLNDDEIKKPDSPIKKPDESTSPVYPAVDIEPSHSPDKENIAPQQTARIEAWPIVTTPDANARVESPRPSTSGGYRTTPTIRVSSPSVQQSMPTGRPVAEQSPQPVLRVQDYDEKHDGKTRKGCCCAVM